MHKTALEHGQLFFDTYLPQLAARQPTIVEIGSQNVNGGLRDVCPAGVDYLGLDFQPGAGVDQVLDDPYTLPLADSSVDAVVTSSCFEHSEFFWLVILEIMRVLKPDGVLYLNAPSNGFFHRWPVDCWRFYPDAGQAMVNWAQYNDYPACLLESFTGGRPPRHEWLSDGSMWNDFVAVILRDKAHASVYSQTMMAAGQTHYWNGFQQGHTSIANQQAESPDFMEIQALHDHGEQLESRLRHLQAEMDALQDSTSWRLTRPLRFIARHVRALDRGSR